MDQTFKILFLLLPLPVLLRMMVSRNKRDGTVGTYSAVIFSCIFYYFFVPFMILLDGGKNATERYKYILNASEWELFLALLAVILFIGSVHFAYNRYNTQYKQKVYTFSPDRLRNICRLITWGTFAIGGISFALYIRAFGGVRRLLELADYLRSFSSSGTEFVSYYASILVVPARLITVTPIVSIALARNGKRYSPLYICIFLVSFVLALIFHLANAGKAGLIIFFLSFAVPLFIKWFKHPWFVVLCCGIAGIPVLGVLDSFFFFMQTGNWHSVSASFASYLPQFAYPAANILNLSGIAAIDGFRWGSDYITALLNILPGIDFTTSTEVTSLFFGGINWKSSGGTPNDIITFGYLQFGYFGVVLSGILVGIICGKMDRLLMRFGSNYGVQVMKCAVIISVFSALMNADPSAIIMNQMHLWVVALCVLFAMKVNTK